MRFNLKFLFVLMLVAGVYFGLAVTAGYWVSAGIMCSLALIVAASLVRCEKLWKHAAIIARLSTATIGLIGLWLLAVDCCWFVDDCPDCGCNRDFVYSRVIGIPVHTVVREYPTPIGAALRDLGQPCRHNSSSRWHKHRLWGLLICGSPCINGIHSLIGDKDVYTPQAQAAMRQVAANDPGLAAEVHRRVIKEHDYAFFWTFFNEHVDPSDRVAID